MPALRAQRLQLRPTRWALCCCSNYQIRIFQTARSRLYRGRFLQPNTHFLSIFRDLQYFHAFAPLRTQNFSKNLPYFFLILTEISQIFAKFWSKFAKFSRNFAGISPEFHRNFKDETHGRRVLSGAASGPVFRNFRGISHAPSMPSFS